MTSSNVKNVLARDYGCTPETFEAFLRWLRRKASLSEYACDGGDIATFDSTESLSGMVAEAARKNPQLHVTHMYASDDARIQGYDEYAAGYRRDSLRFPIDTHFIAACAAERRDMSPESFQALCDGMPDRAAEDDFEL